MTTQLYRLLAKHEGTVLHAYQDSLGLWTIGTGRMIDAKRGGGISQEESDFLLGNDLVKWTGLLAKNISTWTSLGLVRHAVLLDMCHNMGWGGLSSFHLFLRAVEAGDWPAAVKQMENSKWATEVGVARMEDLTQMMQSGDWPQGV